MRSDSQTLSTAQPLALSDCDTDRSRRMFLAIFSLQNGISGTLPFPCQKSPSQNTATLSRMSAKSGLPNTPGGWHSNSRPESDSMDDMIASGIVQSRIILDMSTLLCAAVILSAIQHTHMVASVTYNSPSLRKGRGE
jgi:hypothetical protein